MSNRINKSRLLIGTAIAISLAKVLSQGLSRKSRTGWKKQAQDTATDMWEELQEWREAHRHIPHVHFLLGSLAGSLVGVATALLIAPKPGKELINDLSEAIQPHKRSSSSVSRHVEKKTPARKKTVRQVSATKQTQRKKEARVSHPLSEEKHVGTASQRSSSTPRKKKVALHHPS